MGLEFRRRVIGWPGKISDRAIGFCLGDDTWLSTSPARTKLPVTPSAESQSGPDLSGHALQNASVAAYAACGRRFWKMASGAFSFRLLLLFSGRRGRDLRFGLRHEFFHFRHSLRVFLSLGQVLIFMRVGVLIVELAARRAAVPFGVTPAFVPDAVAHDLPATLVADLLRRGGSAPRGLPVFWARAQAFSAEVGRRLQAAEISQRRIDVHQFDCARRYACDFGFWQRNHERHTGRFLEEQLLLPLAVFAQTPAVVTPEHRDSVAGQIQP